jgi:hypothetical protein
LLLQVAVGGLWVVGRDVGTEVSVGLEWTIFSLVDSPEKVSSDLDTLHLSGHLFTLETNLIHLGGEFGDLIEVTFEASQTDSSLLELTVVKDKNEFVSLTFNPE